MDIEKQVQYWRESALEDLDTSILLIRHKKVNQGLFFTHLALEKALKGIVSRATQATPPLTHNLSKLVDLSQLEFSEEQQLFIARVSTFNLRGRYELPAKSLMTTLEAEEIIREVGELVKWLTQL